VHRDTGHFSGSIETGQGCPLRVDGHTAISVGRNATHGIVCCRLDWHRFCDWFNAKVVTCEIGNIGQLLVNYLSTEMTKVEENKVFAIYAPPFLDLLDDAARNDIARSQVFERGHVALHKVLALAVE